MKFSKIDLSSGDELRLQKGQGLVEFSLLAVFLMILFVGAVQFGYAYFVGVALSDAAQEGAAYASVDPTNFSEANARAIDSLGWAVDPSTVNVNVSESTPGVFCAGVDPYTLTTNAIKVEIKHEIPIFVPFMGGFVGSNSIEISGVSENTILSPACP